MELHDRLMSSTSWARMVWVGAVILMSAMMERTGHAPERAAVLRLFHQPKWVGPRASERSEGAR